ncbi:hypothetical protein PC129_g18953 [Phytophthora cactorum]|uniref:Uncharacterized protein n=1 Tax=Phytophthora cactorum TaxID=29920 RepID=A0A329RJZ5_9STRA|nr:hypothetical protein PC114_g21995 [Phytophthora cactorum]KAG2890351.1 hypothetical protein PC115_g19534 [Phytophthora cactorum]KAG2901328.1 hypothetical protein PC117_g21773 [Phytophthora cactorum]KAG2965502.1 hypothetical protein PC118_g19706 [Phytophthora cactorum]KAG2979240.1 hypothetical protein PC119_g21538 [Phytophthora cactorum]
MDEVSDGGEEENKEDGVVLLEEANLPSSSFVERLTVGLKDSGTTGVDAPLLEIVDKKTVNRAAEYLALAANYETFRLPRAALMPAYASLVTAFEQAERKRNNLSELKQSARLADANAEVDEASLLLV